MIFTIFMLSIFLVSEITVSAEHNLEHKSEEESNLVKHKNYDLYEKIIVDKNSDDADYKSIQDAIDSALTGSTIYVKKGTYNEILYIYKKINLMGEKKGKTFINVESKKNSYAVVVTASGVNISGFSISNNGPGLYAMGIKIIASQTTVEDCDIYNTPIGIAVWSSKNTISNCNFWGCEDEGIAFLGSSVSDCNDNLVTNSEFFNNCDGIELQYSSNNIITNSTFYDNTHAGIDAISSSNDNNVISYCDLYDNEVFGIYLSRSSGNQITRCRLVNNQIMMSGSMDSIIDNCELENIYLKDTTVSIKDCKNVEESNIKTINSMYEIDDEAKAYAKIISEKVENAKEKYYAKFPTIVAILNLIKSRIRIYLNM